jgi:hypothetical protein
MRHEQHLQNNANGQSSRRAGYFSRVMVSAIFAVALAGCNGKENFGDANIGGPILGPQPGLSPDGPALELEVVASVRQGGDYVSARLTNIGYQCGDVIARIPKTGSNRVARCPEATASVELFIGPTFPNANRISLGTVQLPACNGRAGGSAGGDEGCLGGAGFFQVAVSDIVNPPVRMRANNSGVRNRAALLSVLDGNPDTAFVIEIPDSAHEAVAAAPTTDFNGTSYANFIAAWSGWVNDVRTVADVGAAVWPANANQAARAAEVAMNRSRMGIYEFAHDGFSYALTFPGNPNPLGTYSMSGRILVLADGDAISVGVATGVETSVDSALDFLGLEDGAGLDEEMVLAGSDWNLRSVNQSGVVNIDLAGRVIGFGSYDLLEASSNKTDYEVDYPQADIYKPATEDAARFTGTAFSENFNNAPYRIARTGFVSPDLDTDVLNQLPEFYRITVYKACTTPEDPICTIIPEAEISKSGRAGNYPEFIDPDNCRDSCTGSNIPRLTVTKERPNTRFFADGYFHIQILPDGTIITDVDKNCLPVTDMATLQDPDGQQERRIGFVSRTFQGEKDSANISLLMAGPASVGNPTAINESVPPMPFFASQIQGRIDLSEAAMPLYRLSDENFDKKVRSVWDDGSFQAERYRDQVGSSPSNSQRYTQIALNFRGAVAGTKIDSGTCLPVM